MSLDTRIIRNDEPLMLKWKWPWHVNIMLIAWAKDHGMAEPRIIDEANKVLDELDTNIRPLLPEDHPDMTDNIANFILRRIDDAWSHIWKAVQKEGLWEGYTLKNDYTFKDPTDDEVLELKVGDVLWMNIAPAEEGTFV